MKKTATNDRRYECETCVNQASPLCELCTHIITPSGKAHKPKYYIARSEIVSIGGRNPYQEIPAGDPQTDRIARYLMRLLCRRAPIPTGIVLEYNRRTEKEE